MCCPLPHLPRKQNSWGHDQLCCPFQQPLNQLWCPSRNLSYWFTSVVMCNVVKIKVYSPSLKSLYIHSLCLQCTAYISAVNSGMLDNSCCGMGETNVLFVELRPHATAPKGIMQQDQKTSIIVLRLSIIDKFSLRLLWQVNLGLTCLLSLAVNWVISEKITNLLTWRLLQMILDYLIPVIVMLSDS